MPPNIYFDHSSTYLNTGLTPSGPFEVGHSTDITISLLNDGNEAGIVDVKLSFLSPAAGFTPGTQLDLLPLIDAPVDPIIFTVAAATGAVPGTGSKTVGWTPRATDFPDSLGTTVHGCLFAQTTVLPIAPEYPGDTSALDNWDPSYPLCAQHNIDIITVPAPSPTPKPILYAFGAGHGLTRAVLARLIAEPIPGDDPALLAYLNPKRARLRIPETGRGLKAGDIGLTLGAERLWAPRSTGKRTGLRFGYTGQLSTTMARRLTMGRRGKSISFPLDAGEMRQAIVDITPPKGAKRGDFFAVGISNMTMGARRSQNPSLLGTLTLIVRIT